MAGTPEGKIKKQVKYILDSFSEDKEITHQYDPEHKYIVKTLKQFWPVPSGYGSSDLDVIVCYYGQYIAIEVKAPGKKPRPRQNLTIAETIGADGWLFVIDGPNGLDELVSTLSYIRDQHADHS